jgi:oligoendopeptidase F
VSPFRNSFRFELALAVTLWLGVRAAGSAAAGDPHDDAGRYVWDLTSLYENDASWDAKRGSVLRRLETIGHLKGTLGRSAKSLAEALDEIANLRRRAGRLELYGRLRSDADIRSEKATTMAAAGPALAGQVDAAVAFAEEEIRKIGDRRIDEWLRSEPRLDVHRRRIHLILREALHHGSGDSVAILRDLGDWPASCADAYWALLESDLPWPSITGSDGRQTIVNSAAFLRLRNSTDREERMAAIEAFLRRLQPLENTFGVFLTRRIEADSTIGRHRGFRSGIEAQMFREGLPSGAYRAMLDVVHASLPVFHRYLRLRARALGVERLTFDAIRVPVPGAGRRVTAGESLATIVNASAPLGTEFQGLLRERLSRAWVHLPPSPDKRDTYGVFPRVGGSESFGLMSFRDDLPSSRALAGLATLMVTFTAVPPERSFDRWGEDTGIYSNAVLEAGRLLHDDYVIEHSRDRTERLAALVTALDSVSGMFFRYGMVSEFESRVEESVLQGEMPTGSRLSEIYLELLRRFHGHSQGVVAVDEIFAREWATYRVPFISFETLNFPLAAAAAACLVEGARAGDARIRDGFLHLLGRGEIDLSYPLLKQAGVDLATDEPYKAVTRRMNALIDQLEKLVDASRS